MADVEELIPFIFKKHILGQKDLITMRTTVDTVSFMTGSYEDSEPPDISPPHEELLDTPADLVETQGMPPGAQVPRVLGQHEPAPAQGFTPALTCRLGRPRQPRGHGLF